MKNSLKMSSALALCMGLVGCQESLTRTDLVSPYAGDAVARNISAQTIDPWPSYVYDTNIPTSGERQAAVLKKYRTRHDEEPATPGALQIVPAAPPPAN